MTLTAPERQLLDNLEHCQLARKEQGQLGRQEQVQGRQEQGQLGRQEASVCQLGSQEQGQLGRQETQLPSTSKVEKVATELGKL